MASFKGNIVIVEDDSGLNQAVLRLLQAAGFNATSFSSAATALVSDAIKQADCVVLDVHLADMSGFELQHRLSESGHSPPVIIITAHDDDLSRQRAKSIGASAYFPKPFTGRAFVDAVARAVGKEKP